MSTSLLCSVLKSEQQNVFHMAPKIFFHGCFMLVKVIVAMNTKSK